MEGKNQSSDGTGESGDSSTDRFSNKPVIALSEVLASECSSTDSPVTYKDSGIELCDVHYELRECENKWRN